MAASQNPTPIAILCPRGRCRCVLKVRAGDQRVGGGRKGATDNVRRNAGRPTKSIITRDPPTVKLK